MRLHLFSDLHFDVRPGGLPEARSGVDVVIAAGDICEGIENGMAILRRLAPPPTPIVMVAGNHEFYHRALGDDRQAAPDWAAAHGISFLDDSSIVLEGVRFVGATLWTDFELFGAAQKEASMAAAKRYMLDYRTIAVRRDAAKLLTPDATLDLHRASRSYLLQALQQPFSGPTVVVTHHAPHPMSVAARFRDDPVTPAFVSNLSDLIDAGAPQLWVHGHTHTSFDYRLGATRVVCNPKGYGRENRRFDPALVIEI